MEIEPKKPERKGKLILFAGGVGAVLGISLFFGLRPLIKRVAQAPSRETLPLAASLSFDDGVAPIAPKVFTPAASADRPLASANVSVNVVLPPPQPSGPASRPPFHPIIAAMQITGSSANGFIELYNPLKSPVDLSGWSLRLRSQSGEERTISAFPGGKIAAFDYLFMNPASASAAIAADGSAALFDANGKLIDALAWGEGLANPYAEGSPYPRSPGTNRVLQRKVIGDAMQDTGNNAADFEIR